MANSSHSMQIRIASGINVLLGAFLSGSPWLLNYASQESELTRNSVVIGALVVICAALRTVWPGAKAAVSGANIAFGFWTLISKHDRNQVGAKRSGEFPVQSKESPVKLSAGQIPTNGTGTYGVRPPCVFQQADLRYRNLLRPEAGKP